MIIDKGDKGKNSIYICIYIHKDAYETNNSENYFNLDGNWKDFGQGGKETDFSLPIFSYVEFLEQ